MEKPVTIQDYKKLVRKKLDELLPYFAQASVGDFSGTIQVPEKEDEFTGVFAGVKLIIEVVREQLTELQLLNQNLEKKVEERTAEIEAKTIEAKKADMARQVAEMFLTNMSHEIRTPMNAILGYAHLLNNSELKSEQKKHTGIILKSGNHLLGIINDILDLSKLESGKIHFEKKNFTIRNVIESTIEIVSEKAAERKNKLVIAIDPRLKKEVNGDPMRLQQVLLNLLSNAVKFTLSGKIHISATIQSEDKFSQNILFEIKDTGCGIPENELESIFDRLRSVDHFSNTTTEGTGLGLAIVKQVIEQQSGKISVASKPGKGASFQFTLRFLKAVKNSTREKAVILKSVKAGVNGHSLHEKTILVVEDNLINMELVQLLLQKWNMNYTCAVNGMEALSKVARINPDLVLLDLKLPDIDGHEVTRRIRKMKNIDQPVIMALTAHAIEGERKKCIKSGMNDFMSKPFLPEALHSKIQKHIGAGKTVQKNTRTAKRKAQEGVFIDLTYLYEITDGNEKQLKKLMGLFTKNAPGLVKTIYQHFENGNYKNAVETIHQLKSGASTVLVKKQLARIEKIENSFAKKNKAGKRNDLETLKTIISSSIGEIKSRVKQIIQNKS